MQEKILTGEKFVFIVLAVILSKFSVTAVTADCPKDVESHSMTLRLRRHLFCDYDRSVRPSIHHDNCTTVHFRLIPKFIEFEDNSNTLVVHTWMSLWWTDNNLQWEVNNFDGLSWLHVSSDELWLPDISIYNSGDMGHEQNGIPRTDCTLMNEGLALCVPAIKYVTRCVAEYRHWPFDRQNCTIRLGSWSHTGEELRLQLSGDGVEMRDYTANHEWKVLSVNATHRIQRHKFSNDTFPSVFIHIILERHSTSLQVTIIVPAIALIIMNLTVLWLSPMSTERIVMAGLSLVCHLLCLLDLNSLVPLNGPTLPSILIFNQNSMIMACLSLLLTTILRQLREMSIPAPGWLTSSTALVLGTRVGQFVLLATLDPKASASVEPEEDSAGLVQPNLASTKTCPGICNAWRYVATLLDRLSFVGVLFTYIIMIIVLIPKNDIVDVPNISRF